MLFLVLVVAFVGSTALVEAIELPKDDGVVVEPARVHMTKAINKTSGGRVTQVNVDKAELEDIDKAVATLRLWLTVVSGSGDSAKTTSCTSDVSYELLEFKNEHYKCDDPQLNSSP